jgi:uncharacterized Zn finger protein
MPISPIQTYLEDLTETELRVLLLEKIRIVLVRLERTNDWKALLESLHTVHKRKRLFTQMLGQLPS